MSALGDAMRGIQQLLTLQLRIDQLEASNRRVAEDNKALADGLQLLSERVARIEGMIEGAEMVRSRRARLPKA